MGDQAKAPHSSVHSRTCVHGDIRPDNIMVRMRQRQLEGKGDWEVEGIEVRLLDLDWAGECGTRRYPTDLNEDLFRWARGARKGRVITKEDDDDMVSHVLAQMDNA